MKLFRSLLGLAAICALAFGPIAAAPAYAAALTITAANVAPSTGAKIKHGTAGASVTAGQSVYLDATTNTYKLSDSDSATAAVRVVDGIALHAAASGQPLAVQESGRIAIGATVTVGTAYYASPTAGGVGPVGDLTTGNYPTFLGFAVTSSVIDLQPVTAGVAVP